jgi:ketosteroid isomerase-like protein
MREVVVTPVGRSGTPRRSRTLEERLMVRFPGAWRALSALVQRLLSPRSRVRRALLRRTVVSGLDAASRRDFELMLVRYAPDVENEFAPEFEALGLGGTFRGHDGMVKMIEAFGEAWERWELQPATVLDLGDQLLVLSAFRLPGNVSGLVLEQDFAQLITPRRGLVAREQAFMSWDKGLRAAGLDPDAVALPSGGKADEAAAVRTPLGADARLRTRRSLDERLIVRWPRAWATLIRVGSRLPPRSRLRRAAWRRIALSGWSAWARGDLDLMLVRYAPDCQFEPPPEYVRAGMRSAYSGHVGAREQAADLRESWERMDITPLEIVDAGDRLVVLGHVHIRARGSRVELDSQIGVAYWVRRGLIVRECPFFDWDEALRAAGIPASTVR